MEYALHVLQIKLFEWKGIVDIREQSISRYGPNEFDCTELDVAQSKVKDITEAIEKLNQPKHDQRTSS